MQRQERLERRAEYKTRVEAIVTEALSPNNLFKLSDDEFRHFSKVTRTLIHILDNMDIITSKNELYDPEGIIPPINAIHVENFGIMEFDRTGSITSVIRKFYGDECEDFMVTSLFNPFFETYQRMKSAGSSHMRVYCSKMNKFCINECTVHAFEYAYQYSAPFNDIISLCLTNLSSDKKQSYSWLLASIVNHAWGQYFKPDKGAGAIITYEGFFDFNGFGIKTAVNPNNREEKEEKITPHFGSLNKYLRREDNPPTLAPTLDFLNAYLSVKPESREIYFKILLNQPEFLNTDLLNPSAKIQFNCTKKEMQFHAQQEAAAVAFDKFFIEQFGILMNMLDKSDLSQPVFLKLLNAASDAALVDIWKKNEFFLGSTPLQNGSRTIKFQIECMLAKLSQNTNQLKKIFTSPNAKGLTFLHYAVESDDVSLVTSVLTLAQTHQIDLKQATANLDSPLVHAVRKKKFQIMQSFLPGSEVDSKITPEEAKDMGNALLIAAANADWNIVNRLSDAHADLTLANEDKKTALHLAAETNQANTIDKLLENGADINQPLPSGKTLLMAASEDESKITNQTLYQIITANGLDLIQHNQGIDSLVAATYQTHPAKLFLLLTLPEIDIEAAQAVVHKTTSSSFYPYNNYDANINILYASSLVKHLLDPDYVFRSPQPISCLNNLSQTMLDKVFSAFLSSQRYDDSIVSQAKWVLRKVINHLSPYISSSNPLPVISSFSDGRFYNQLSAYNTLFLLARESNSPHKVSWLIEIRTEAKSALDRYIAQETNINTKKTLLEEAEKADIFSKSRSLTLFKTRTQKAIQSDLAIIDSQIQKRTASSSSLSIDPPG